MMKLSVAWESDVVTADQICGKMSSLVGTPLLAEYDERYHHTRVFQMLSFRVASYGGGQIVAGQIESYLDLNHGILADTWIDGKPAGYYICRLEAVVKGASKTLKETRGLLPNKRLAEVRQQLEAVIK